MSKTHQPTFDAFSLVREIKSQMSDTLENRLLEGAVVPLLPEILDEHINKDAIVADWNDMSEEEAKVVIALKELGRQLGSDQGEYDNGVLTLCFKNKIAMENYTDQLELNPQVYGYEVEAYAEDLVHGYLEDDELEIDHILFDGVWEFEVTVYLEPSIVQYSAEEIEITDEDGDGYSDQLIDDENGQIFEVRRRIKVNFRGKRRVKMQCRVGFKWDATKKACVKITGAEVAQKRKSMRKAVRTRKSKGQGMKVRVARKTRKAKRFRKSMGLK